MKMLLPFLILCAVAIVPIVAQAGEQEDPPFTPGFTPGVDCIIDPRDLLPRREDGPSGNCVIDSQDLLYVGAAYGPVATIEPSWTPAATASIEPSSTSSASTPTFTPAPASATPSPVPTATPSPTASAHTATPTSSPTSIATYTATSSPVPSSAYTVEDLIADTTGRNDGSVCPPVNTYNWGIEGHGLTGRAPQGDQITGWWTAQWVSCGASSPNITLEIRNFRTLGLLSPGWATFGGNWNNWCATSDPNTVSNYGGCAFVGSGVAMPMGQRALHGATHRMADMNVQCVVVVYEARSNGAIMVNAGADHISGGSILGDMFISRYVRLAQVWRTLGATSCTRTQLYSNPPPGIPAEN